MSSSENIRAAFLLVAIAFACLLSAPRSALAIDCAKAKTPVETAICSDDYLKQQDADLSASYFDALRESKYTPFVVGKESLHDYLQSSQRAWLAKRDKECGAVPPDRIKACIMGAFQSLGQETEEQVSKESGLTIGTAHLTVKTLDEVTYELDYKGNKIADIFAIDKVFVQQRWDSPQTNAALVTFGDYGSLACEEVYVFETRLREGFESHDLGMPCGVSDSKFTLGRTKTGLALFEQATPSEEGAITEWDAETGAVTTRKIPFRPWPGTKMEDLVKHERGDLSEPLMNEEFFNAVNKIPEEDRKRFFKQLWNATIQCPLEPAELFCWRFTDKNSLAYYGCEQGQYQCAQTDYAFALWLKKSRRLFFAVRPQQSDNDSDVHLYPPRSRWPKPALAKLADWMKNPYGPN